MSSTLERERQIRKWIDEGISDTQIGEILGVKAASVKRFRMRHKISRQQPEGSRGLQA